jgi:transmembrane sensor
VSNRDRDRLLVKHLLGEASPEEGEKIAQWIGAHPSHRQYAEAFRRIWVESRRLAPAEPVDPTVAWERFLESGKLGGRVVGTRPAETRMLDARFAGGRAAAPVAKRWSAIAAVLILLAAGSYTWWKLDVQTIPLAWQSGTAIRIDTLPDGSRVTLNKFSSLRLSGDKTSRAVRLSGEAFFEVAHDARRPFTVQVNEVTIRDEGTGFNVRSTDSTTEIIVETGAVLVSAGSGTTAGAGTAMGSGTMTGLGGAGAVKVSAGEKVLVTAGSGTGKVAAGSGAVKANAGEGTITKTPVSNRLYQYYRTKRFLCRNTPLSELITVLNEAYGTHIVVQKEEINRLQMTATFDDEDLDSILTVITKTFGLNIQKKGGSILLKQP